MYGTIAVDYSRYFHPAFYAPPLALALNSDPGPERYPNLSLNLTLTLALTLTLTLTLTQSLDLGNMLFTLIIWPRLYNGRICSHVIITRTITVACV